MGVGRVAIPVLAVILASCAGNQPGSVSMRFSWHAEPEGVLHLWFSVEEREDAESAGIVLSSIGPREYHYGEPLSVDLSNVPNGHDRYVVVEAREGTGQGLPVSQKILREHGGDVHETSTPGEGSRFTLELPAVSADTQSDVRRTQETQI